MDKQETRDVAGAYRGKVIYMSTHKEVTIRVNQLNK
jgi:hypothetical protein